MHSVVVGQDHNGQQITNADLTLIPPASLHPDVLSREVSVLDALADVDTTTTAPLPGDALTWNGASWVPKAGSTNSYYREAFTVGTVPAVLTVVHDLAVDVVSVTVIRRGSPNVVVTPRISAIDVNTVEVAIEGGPVGDYEVLVLSEGGGGGGTAPAGDYLPLTGGEITGPLTVTNNYLTMTGDGYGLILHGGGRLYKRTGAGLVLRRHADLAVQTESTDGTTRWDMLDKGNILSTSYNVTWANSFTGTFAFRVSPSMVSCYGTNISRGVATAVSTQVEMLNYPSGVPAPPGTTGCIAVIGDETNQAGGLGICNVEFRTDGVYLRTWNTGMNDSNHRLYGIHAAWAR